jgi:hypothetical protein
MRSEETRSVDHKALADLRLWSHLPKTLVQFSQKLGRSMVGSDSKKENAERALPTLLGGKPTLGSSG